MYCAPTTVKTDEPRLTIAFNKEGLFRKFNACPLKPIAVRNHRRDMATVAHCEVQGLESITAAIKPHRERQGLVKTFLRRVKQQVTAANLGAL